MAKQRILYLDVLRVLACGMVLLMHSPHPNSGVPSYVQVPLYFITAAGLVLFFMIIGALLLSTKMSTGAFLKRRIGKIAGPWLFWTLFYIAIDIPKGKSSFGDIEKLFVYVSSPGRHIMWFMFVLLGLYLITPILSRFVSNASRKEILFYLILWCITLALPWFSPYSTLQLGISSPLYYFAGYVGYYLLGYYLHLYKPNIVKYVPLLLVLPLVAKYAYVLLDGQRSDDLFWYLSIPVMLMSIAWFSLFQKICESRPTHSNKRLSVISDCTFGVYLVHLFVMRNLLWKLDFVVYDCGWIGQIIISWALTVLISFGVVYIISFLPYSEFIIGYHQKLS